MMVNFYFNQSIQLIYALNILQFIVHSLGEEDGGGGMLCCSIALGITLSKKI